MATGSSAPAPPASHCQPSTPLRYFTSQRTLPATYWTGMSRPGAFNLYAFPDTSYLSQLASNEPYAHW